MSEYVTVIRDGKEYELWVGFDLDGTLVFDEGWQGCNPDKIGYLLTDTYVYKMFIELYKIGKFKNKEGKRNFKVKIFTARACEPKHVKFVWQWARKYSLFIPEDVEVTATKDYGCRAIVDDRGITVVKNKGILATPKQLVKEMFNFI